MKYLKSSIEVFEVLFHFTTFPVGWVGECLGGWVGERLGGLWVSG